MKRLCSALLVLAAAGCGSVDVQGIVRDERTGEPLPGATVRIGDDETETDYRGFYELSVDEDEAKELSVDKPGYRAFSEDVSFEGVEEVIQDVDLAPQGRALEGQSQGLDRQEPTLHDDPLLHDQGLEQDGLRRAPNLQEEGGQQGSQGQGQGQGGSFEDR